jgi:acetolactate synthase-1/2/3 large subunit
MTEQMKTVGEVLIDILEANGVEHVFGIPGVHTVELYRGLAASTIRHVTPRHEQGAAFMADGYARVSGKPGVCLLITGPGLTNAITAMAQAGQDSVPMLVISGVNRRDSLGHGRGRLHELPDQRAMMASFCLMTHTLLEPNDLSDVMARAFTILRSGRPGPVHIEIPTDVMSAPIPVPALRPARALRPRGDIASLKEAARLCEQAKSPVILAGGGAARDHEAVRRLAEQIDAPVITTANARGIMPNHPLAVPASASLQTVRAEIAGADLVIALGTQFGPTDYDVYVDGGFPVLANVIHVDVDVAQLGRNPATHLPILSTVENMLGDLLVLLDGYQATSGGASRAEALRKAARAELSAKMRNEVAIIETVRDALPGTIIVGDSTQAVYAGNLYFDAGRPFGWFNAATGFGALGYGPPAAIGAALAEPESTVVCLTGDGGFQFTLAEIGSARDIGAKVIYLVWNNDGYQEIETYMVENGITPEGVRPSAPDFIKIGEAYGLPSVRLSDVSELADALKRAASHDGPSLIEVHETGTKGLRV